MTDDHIHIGQFENVYYDPIEIIDVIMSAGIHGISFSSVSSCIDNILYSDIEKEILFCLTHIPYSDEIIRPFLWYTPNYINQSITVESAFAGISYKGIKLHPFAQNWDYDDMRHMETLHAIFDYAARNSLPILIHTGHNSVDNADRFERFMCEYSNAKCILAHCRPLDATIKLLKKYRNVYCDTAFTKKTDILQIAALGLDDKIIFGSDFPITHYFRTKYPSCNDDLLISLKEQYLEDITDWKILKTEFKKVPKKMENKNNYKFSVKII